MSSQPHILTWKALLDKKARDLHEQIAATYAWVQENANGDPVVYNNLTAKLYDWLRDLYEHELPIVKILDEADLSLELNGPAIRIHHPKLSIVTKTFGRVQKKVNDVARSISGISEAAVGSPTKRFQIPDELQLGFAALSVNNAMRFGFTLPEPDEKGSPLLREHDPMFQAVTRAVNAIRDVSIAISEVEDEEEAQERISEVIDDPKLRDSALSAVRDFTPTGRKGLDSVMVCGRSTPSTKVKPLTFETRKTLTHILAKPVKSDEVLTLSGDIREIDLDQHRFEIRQITAGAVNDLRCIYSKKVTDTLAKQWLGDRVEVTGRVERDIKGNPRLMRITHLKTSGSKPGAKQTEFKFEEDE